MTECVLIADDLTGACDAAGPFATAGLRTVVRLAGEVEAEVVALSTDSRDVDPDDARRRLFAVAPAVRQLAPRVIFKKIDSTLRGNTRHEIVAALEAFGCETAVVTPAFPVMGRIVEAGRLRVTTDARFAPIDLGSWFDRRFEVADAVCDKDLDAIAGRLLDGGGARVLWAGSAGLAGALARRLHRTAAARALRGGSVLFCIGSDHSVTVEQQARLLACRSAEVLAIPRGDVSAVRGRTPEALFLCGGDTAALVCRALQVEAIDIVREFEPGIPIGILRGGPLHGTPVVTKSGGFGKPDTLVAIADYFSTL